MTMRHDVCGILGGARLTPESLEEEPCRIDAHVGGRKAWPKAAAAGRGRARDRVSQDVGLIDNIGPRPRSRRSSRKTSPRPLAIWMSMFA
jgi:hypothetical protein